MNEAETRAEHIDPALKAAGWGVVEGSRVLREHGITLGRLQGGGKRLGLYDVLPRRRANGSAIALKGGRRINLEGGNRGARRRPEFQGCCYGDLTWD